MKIDIVTLFPGMFSGVLSESIVGRARASGAVEIGVTDFRLFARNRHNTVDDTPYGGGGGMVLKPGPIFDAVESLYDPACDNPRIILTCPQGVPYTQDLALELAKEKHLIVICGHYEGYDDRIRQHLITDEISIGDYVLTGGEIPAMVIVDSVVRLLPGVLGNDTSAELDSFRNGLLEHPHYTRPYEYRGWKVPDVLLSGHHEKIEQWRRRESLRRTFLRRPDLLKRAELSDQERRWLEEIAQEAKESPHRTS
jgi:tRNA (guanine37-N1)-methyltransferase